MTQEIITNELPIKGIRTGRKINPNSTRQKRLAELEIRRANGELQKGRPINQNSIRQKRLAEMKARAELNGGIIKRGRPAITLGISTPVEIDVLGG